MNKFLAVSLLALLAVASASPDRRSNRYPQQQQQQYQAPEESADSGESSEEQQQYQPPQQTYSAPAPKPSYSRPPTYKPQQQQQQYRPVQPSYVPAQTQQYAQAAQAPATYVTRKPIAILSQDFQLDDYGYKFNYETEDYQKKDESAKIIPGTKKNQYGEDEDGSLQVEGSYSYTAPDGTQISLRYTADENGFQPSGDHLPVAPELPEELLKAIAEHEAAHAEARQRPSYQQQQPQASYQQPQYQQPAKQQQQQQYYQ